MPDVNVDMPTKKQDWTLFSSACQGLPTPQTPEAQHTHQMAPPGLPSPADTPTPAMRTALVADDDNGVNALMHRIRALELQLAATHNHQDNRHY
jgi:hypothetical protein